MASKKALTDDAVLGLPVIISDPPSSFSFTDPQQRRASVSSEDEEGRPEILRQLKDVSPQTINIRNKATRAQVKNGLKILNAVTLPPFSKVWHVGTQVIAVTVFLLNVAVAIVDLIKGNYTQAYLWIALIFGMIEAIVTSILWLVGRVHKFREPEIEEKFKKNQQYIENILGEVFLYVLLVIGILGLEYDFSGDGDAFEIIEFSLAVIDLIALIYNQGQRAYMVYKLFRNIKLYISEEGIDGARNWKTAGYILPRSFWMIIGNFFVINYLLAMFAIQVYIDNPDDPENPDDNSYTITESSAMLIVCIILLPFLNIGLFLGGNLFWVFEILTRLNVKVGEKRTLQEKLREKYSDALVDSISFAQNKVNISKKVLATNRDLTLWSKLIYFAAEPAVVVVATLTSWLIVATVFLFGYKNENMVPTGYPDDLFIYIQIGFAIVFVCASPQLFFVLIMSNIVAIFGLGRLVVKLFLEFTEKKPCKCGKKKTEQDEAPPPAYSEEDRQQAELEAQTIVWPNGILPEPELNTTPEPEVHTNENNDEEILERYT